MCLLLALENVDWSEPSSGWAFLGVFLGFFFFFFFFLVCVCEPMVYTCELRKKHGCKSRVPDQNGVSRA